MHQARSDPQHGIPWSTRCLTDDFADDLALLGETAKFLQSMTDNLVSTAAKVGLRISREKTKVMSVTEQQPMALKEKPTGGRRGRKFYLPWKQHLGQ